ncbi:MAG: RNA polymerase sigma factor WhiG [Thermoleophilia bacterium]
MARLDEDKVKELWYRYKNDGDQRARDRLILAYAPLVKYVAGRMANGLPSHIEEADLISYGLLGLIGALDRFDPSREIKFETYAVSRIKGSIIDELRSLDWVPRSVRSKAREIEKVCALLENRLQRAPTDVEIANELGMTVNEFQHALTQISNTSIVALDELWAISGSDGDSASLIDTLEDPKSKDPSHMLDLSEMKARLADAIDALPKREKIVIALYYYENLTLREIGEVLGVTESRVSQLHTKAVLRLKGRLRDEIEPSAIG